VLSGGRCAGVFLLMYETTISVVDSKTLLPLFGTGDQHVRKIRSTLGVAISARDGHIRVEGDEAAVSMATDVFEQLTTVLNRRGAVSSADVDEVMARVTGDGPTGPAFPSVEVMLAGHQVCPRTSGQAAYIKAITEHDLVFSVGPAGTGKTYLAVAMAVAALRQEAIRKIVLVRPAVEAGESLGYLPGDIEAKINPYLRPLLDALREMMDYDQFKRLSEQDVIEVVPLAYMRGRTLNEAFIILDEAQNSTVAQMKMFLTRMGTGSKIVVAGDITQVDLPSKQQSGMIDALTRLSDIEEFCRVDLTEADIVRHRLVQQIVRAYDTRRPSRPGGRRRK